MAPAWSPWRLRWLLRLRRRGKSWMRRPKRRQRKSLSRSPLCHEQRVEARNSANAGKLTRYENKGMRNR